MRRWIVMLSDILVTGFVAWYVRVRWGNKTPGKPAS